MGRKTVTGWKEINGFDCYIEDGKIIRIDHDGKTCYAYKASKSGGFDKVEPTEAQFKRNAYRIM